MQIERLFFSLIKVAIGKEGVLCKTPTTKEWQQLYDMAKKQSLVGICFAGVQKQVNQNQELPEMLYLTWMGMAAKIQQRNEVVNRQCAELQAKLSADGLRSCVFKGQAIAQLYPDNLKSLRQSGDIDIYVDCGRERAIKYAKTQQETVAWDYKHLHLNVFKDTEVEMHYRTEIMFNVLKNRSVRRWEESDLIRQSIFAKKEDGITSASDEFNLVYLLLHMYNHAMSEGCGLRQYMDYYCLLSSINSDDYKNAATKTIEQFGMKKFAAGVMWVLHEVFGLDYRKMLLPADESAGRYLLRDAIEGGNFGRHDKSRHWGQALYPMKLVYDWFTRDMRILRYVSSEALWYPVWVVYHFVWKRVWGWKHGIKR